MPERRISPATAPHGSEALPSEVEEAIGIPVYGVPGGGGDPDGNGVHGLNERRSVRSVFVGRDFLTDLVKLYADSD